MFSWFFSKPLPVGSVAPDFILADQDGIAVRLYQLRGKNVVLVFYPADETRICRQQLCEFRDLNELALRHNVCVYGVNPGSAQSHSKFRNHHDIPFPLLVDAGQKVASLYRASGLLVRRTVYLVGADGLIRFSRRGKPDPEQVFQAVNIEVSLPSENS